MNWYFVAAGMLLIATGLVHSIFGEMLVFRRMRAGRRIPTNGGQVLREAHVRILWASWHLATVMGACVAILLVWLAQPSSRYLANTLPVHAATGAMLASSLLVYVGTQGKHPGWLALLLAAILALTGQLVS